MVNWDGPNRPGVEHEPFARRQSCEIGQARRPRSRSDANVLAVALLGLSVPRHGGGGTAGGRAYCSPGSTAASRPAVQPCRRWPATRCPRRHRLEVSPPIDLLRFCADEERLLGQYAWLDRQQGIVRIPIDLAWNWCSSGACPHPSIRVGAKRAASPHAASRARGRAWRFAGQRNIPAGSPPGAVHALPPNRRRDLLAARGHSHAPCSNRLHSAARRRFQASFADLQVACHPERRCC